MSLKMKQVKNKTDLLCLILEGTRHGTMQNYQKIIQNFGARSHFDTALNN